ncbi:CbtB domain-containing protein [Aurantimonas marianensis]|uniref:CbtB-domain containing protein n=1 Tax=Aurantimonas marianensis TaxID=2920428 RepID=A0A9X2HAL6_9HYPH|nr:CbtB-domain containing protein [Aurantimonas marianensis]MCP3054887.1 CbtB-domain containing protein [Aurantimonas marianensis]
MTATTYSIVHAGASTRIATGLAALVLGVFFVFGIGFAHSAAVHDTAHDVRHSYGFPCH